MESLPSDSRQPPDGHEFPDYEENFKKPKKISSSDKFSLNYVHNNEVNINEKESYQKYSNLNMHKSADSNTILKNDHSINDETIKYDNSFNSSYFIKSQSLSDISYDKKQNEQWFNLVEQRRKSLSKLKGLVIPDSISENDCSSNINLPEIKSNTFANIETMNSLDDSSEASNETSQPSSVDSIKFPWISPPWTGNGNFPKYSPAFKRKDLSLYYTTANKDTNEKSDSKYHSLLRLKKSINQAESSSGDDSTFPLNLDNSSTRSESSFECTSSRNKPKQRNRSYRYSKESNLLNDYRKNKKEINTEDESDNDSTISSSQSSFISRTTPSPSPTGSVDYDTSFTPINSDYRFSDGRQLKSASVEAINRRNILASAKCRSGKDLKVGSPIINRKSPELDNEDKEKGEEENKPIFETENEQPIIRDLPKEEEFKPIVKERTMIAKEPTLIIKEPPTSITKEPIPKVREIKVNEKENLQKNVEKENSLPKAQTFQPIPRRFSADKILDLQTKSSTAVLKNKFETMSVTRETPQRRMSTISTSRDYLTNYKDNLETNIQKKKEEKLSKFKNTKSLSVTDLRKNFEEIVKLAPNKSTNKISNVVVTSRKSDISTPSFRSNKIIDKIPTVHESKVRSTLETKKLLHSKMANIDSREVILKPSVPSENIGIVLNGGRDENKEVTVHRIRYGSVAYQEGTLTKGDHIISINGVNTDGLSHFEATELLKTDARIFVILVRNNGNKPVEEMSDVKKKRSVSLGSTNIPKISQSVVVPSKLTQSNHEIILRKDGNGLGFSIEGGKDSPIGDVPLVVKKIFQGGVADKDGKLKVGDEILVINDIECSNLSRIQAWTMMKKLDLGDVKILISR